MDALKNFASQAMSGGGSGGGQNQSSSGGDNKYVDEGESSEQHVMASQR